jgi:hypothetical protein
VPSKYHLSTNDSGGLEEEFEDKTAIPRWRSSGRRDVGSNFKL